MRHDMFTGGSKYTWLLTLGSQFTTKGEIKKADDIFTDQLAQTLAHLLGYNFTANHEIAGAISLK